MEVARIVHGIGRAALGALLGLLISAGGVVAGTAAPAAACSCVQLDLPSLAKQGDAVFVGTPVDDTEQDGKRAYEVRVSDVYKGAPGPTVTLTTAADEGDCGLELELDRQYMVVGKQSGAQGPVTADACSGTQPVSDDVIGEVESALGPATPFRGADPGNDELPGDETDGDEGSGQGDAADEREEAESASGESVSAPYIVIGGALVLAVGASFLLPRLRRRNRSAEE